nr:MDIS1-interacting receptor like kinase 2-like [Ziziphus jujuba var. spinosa]
MGKWCMRTSSKQQMNLTPNILSEREEQGVFYKAELSTGQVVAVKKLRANTDCDDHQMSQNHKAFMSEIQKLTQIRHRNIVKLYGFCSHQRYSLLVYEFIEGGSLRNVLNNEEEAKAFGWSKRVNVVKGVADVLSYLHHDCSPPIIHQDISTQNILLNAEHGQAYVSDFGTGRRLKPDSSNWTSFARTFGYAAPGDLISSLSLSWSLSSSATPAYDQVAVMDTLEQRLPPLNHQEAREVLSLAKIAFACLHVKEHHWVLVVQVNEKANKDDVDQNDHAGGVPKDAQEEDIEDKDGVMGGEVAEIVLHTPCRFHQAVWDAQRHIAHRSQ